MNFWSIVSRFILKQRFFILLVLGLFTVFLFSKIQNIQFSHTEANLLPKDHEENIKYDKFLEIFGEEGNLIILAVQDTAVFKAENFNKWNDFSKQLDAYSQVDFAVSIGDIKKLKKDKKNQKFIVEPLYKNKPVKDIEVLKIKDELFNNLPFFDNFLFNKNSGTIRTAIYLQKDIVNTKIRERFVFDDLNPAIEQFEKETGLDVRVSGMPYIRTMNAQNIIDE
ncbi:MAG: RND family transporter, partial [Flavobacteriaceae bacterium]|nr:RND family transporter [Flavobacteriaceae bacterium]